MPTKNSLIFEIGLFVRSADGKKATCIECKQNNRQKCEFELPKSSTRSAIKFYLYGSFILNAFFMLSIHFYIKIQFFLENTGYRPGYRLSKPV
jgi:hypothetical protein